MRPGQSLPLALAGCALLAALGVFWAPLAALGAGMALACLTLAVLEGLWLRRLGLSATRPEVSVYSLGERSTLRLALAHDSASALELTARTRLPALLQQVAITQRGLAGAGTPLVLEVPVEAVARGKAQLQEVAVAATRFGLAERIALLPAPAGVQVLPDLRAVRKLHARLNQLFLRGLGTRMAARLGQGREFDRLREYVRGDDYRNLAWKASARRGKHIVREHRLDRSQDILLCVDRGHRMAGRVGALTRTDHAVNAAIVAAYLCNRAEDRVGMLSFSAEVERGLAQGRGAPHLAALTSFATGIEPEFLNTDYLALAAHLRRRLRARTLVLLFTVLPERGDHGDLLRALKMLLPRHLPLVIVLRDPGLDAVGRSLPATRDELSRTLVASELSLGRAQLVRELRHLGALVVETSPEESGAAAVNAYLDVKRRQLL